MNKVLILIVAVAVGWFFFYKPAGASYFNTQEAMFDVTVVTPTAMYTGQAKMQYGGTVSFNGLEYHKLTFVFEPKLGMPDEYLFTRLTEKGIYAYTMAPKKEAPEYPLVQFPLNVGSKWHDMILGYPRENTLSSFSSCDTPTKTYYRCVHIRSKADFARNWERRTTVYAPDVGVVKIETSSAVPKRTIEMVRRAQ